MSSDIFGTTNLYNYNQTQGFNFSDPSMLTDPDTATLYIEKTFSDLFDNFLNGASGTDSSNSSSEFDMFSSTDNSLDGSMDYYSSLMQLYSSTGQNTDLGLLNQAASLIGKDVTYANGTVMSQGIIESVLNEDGSIYFQIGPNKVAIDDLIEIREGELNA